LYRCCGRIDPSATGRQNHSIISPETSDEKLDGDNDDDDDVGDVAPLLESPWNPYSAADIATVNAMFRRKKITGLTPRICACCLRLKEIATFSVQELRALGFKWKTGFDARKSARAKQPPSQNPRHCRMS
jgi:hypothetical protein